MSERLRSRELVGEIVHYWTHEGGELVPNAAIVLAISTTTQALYLHVFWSGGFGGRDTLWALPAPRDDLSGRTIPREGHWTYRSTT